MHATEEEARTETQQMLNVYADFFENVLAMPVIKGRKTDKEKFNGAEETYTVECMMHDKKALQGGTSHYFGDGFARAFDITFAGKDNLPHYPHQTSWGVSTRMIGGIIMTHGDDNGLVLPPRVAPVQVIVIPVAQHKDGVIAANEAVMDRLTKAGQGYGKESVRPGPPGQRGEDLRLPGQHRGHCGGDAGFHPRWTVRQSEEKPGGQHLRLRHPGRSQGEDGPAGRLCQDHVVRRSGVRAEDEGSGRRLFPVHPL